MLNNALLLLTTALLIIAIFYILHLRTQQKSYSEKIRSLKTRQQELEQRLTSNESLDTIVAQVNEAVLRMNGSGKILGANPTARELFGIADASLPQPMRRFLRDDEWNQALISALKALPELSRLPEIEISGYMLEPRLAQLENGEALLLCLDVTTRHRLEQQRRTFLSNLMHDLKTPLTSLLGYARSMECFGDQPDFRKEASAVIADEAKHVNHLLDVLLTLDQAEFGKQPENARSDAIEIIQRACEMLKASSAEQQISLCFEHHEQQLPLAISFDDLDRIITNLLVNAMNHSPEHGQITVLISRQDEMATITIEDEGPGIPEKHLPRVTERFYRVDKARSRVRKSHGLGLAIVKELLDANHGSLSLANREPHGLSAGITIPLASMNEPA